MKRHLGMIGSGLIWALLLVPSVTLGQDLSKPRAWTNRDGESVTAALVDVDVERAIAKFRKEDGSPFNVGLRFLADADQELLRKWIAARKGSGGITSPESGKLATFADGEWQGYNIVFQSQLYDAALDADGRFTIYPKENGVRVGKYMTLAFGCHYYSTAKRQTVARAVVTYENPPTPKITTSPVTVELKGTMEDDVDFEFEIKLQHSGFAIEGKVKDPGRIDYPSRYGYHVSVQGTLNPSAEMSFDEIKAAVDGWSLTLRPLDGRAVEYPYWKSMKSQGFKEAIIVGPWGRRVVTVDAPEKKDRETKASYAGTFGIYSDQASYRGFYLGRNGTDKQVAGRLDVEIE